MGGGSGVGGITGTGGGANGAASQAVRGNISTFPGDSRYLSTFPSQIRNWTQIFGFGFPVSTSRKYSSVCFHSKYFPIGFFLLFV